ncbi:MAG: cation-transporting P-type ATPase, partial [Nitrospiraceae bacterium]|nr:cation-transporting P-type ATPase [Nitrospiraceae bacterium]
MFKLSSIIKPAIDSSLSNKPVVSNGLLESAQADVSVVLQTLHSEAEGLNEEESLNRRKHYEKNELAKEK